MTFSLDGSLTVGDPVQLYWFPTLTVSDYDSNSLSEGTTYGFYRDSVGIDGSAQWVVPGDGSTVSLKFLTEGQGGSNPESAGWASLTVVPEASNLIFGALALGLVACRVVPQIRRSLAKS